MLSDRHLALSLAGVAAIPAPWSSGRPDLPPPPLGWKLAAFLDSLDLTRTPEGPLVIRHAGHRIAVSRRLLGQLAESPGFRRNGDLIGFDGQTEDGTPLTVTYRQVGFDPTSHPHANEGGFHLLQRVEQETL